MTAETAVTMATGSVTKPTEEEDEEREDLQVKLSRNRLHLQEILNRFD